MLLTEYTTLLLLPSVILAASVLVYDGMLLVVTVGGVYAIGVLVLLVAVGTNALVASHHEPSRGYYHPHHHLHHHIHHDYQHHPLGHHHRHHHGLTTTD